MKTEEQATEALGADSFLNAELRPVNGKNANRWAFRAGEADFEADVAFRVAKTGAWLFVEPDDAARSPANVAKYLMWIEMNHISERVHFIHPIGAGNDSAWSLSCFLGSRMESLHANFFYHPFRVQDWKEDRWIIDLCEVAQKIVNRELSLGPAVRT